MENVTNLTEQKTPKQNVSKKLPVLPMAERYRKSWDIIFNKTPEWRKKEIKRTQLNGTFGNKGYDKDFIQSVIDLAESNETLN